MAVEYRYRLRPGSRHDECPSCGKKTFKPYIDASGVAAGRQYGRCERVNSCSYTKYPPSERNDDNGQANQQYRHNVNHSFTPQKPIDYVSPSVVEETLSYFNENIFLRYITSCFGRKTAETLQRRYNIGTANNGGTIFWQQDDKGRFRTGKVIYYTPSGKRDKNRSSWFVHKRISPTFNYQQCFFGIHLVDGSRPVALCESEKTAVMMSVINPDYIWIATGGSEMINAQRLSELVRLDKVFPDHNQFEKWELKTRHYAGRQMDVSVEMAANSGMIPEGSDILDLVLAQKNG